MKSINARVQESFSEANHEDVLQYLEWVSSKMVSQAQSLRRMIASIVLIIAVFELTNEYPKTQLSFGSFHLYKGSVVIEFLPALCAFFYLQSMIETFRLNDAQRVYFRVFRKWSTKAARNQLEYYVMPSMPIYWNVGAYAKDASRGFLFRLEFTLSMIFWAFITYGVLAFEAQAYYDLFELPARDSILWILSVSAATFCCLAALTMSYANTYNRLRSGDLPISRRWIVESVKPGDSD